MPFTPRTWVARDVQYPGRIILTPTGNTNEYDSSRSEGNINTEGDILSAELLNDFENRIKDGFDNTVPRSRKIAGLQLSQDITLTQLIAAGLAPSDSGYTFNSTGYTKLPNGLILEWINYTTPEIAPNTAYDAQLSLSHITTLYYAGGNIVPIVVWDFGKWTVVPLGNKMHVVISNGATAQTINVSALAIGI